MKRAEVQIQSPCTASWAAMEGDDARRYCGRCDKHVHDLSAMTERAARAVVAQPNVCVRHGRSPPVPPPPQRAASCCGRRPRPRSAGLSLPAVADIPAEGGEVGLASAWEALTRWADDPSDAAEAPAGVEVEVEAETEAEIEAETAADPSEFVLMGEPMPPPVMGRLPAPAADPGPADGSQSVVSAPAPTAGE